MANSSVKIYRFKAGFGEAEVTAMREGVSAQMREAGVPGDSSYALMNVLDEFCCNMMEHSQASWIEIVVEPKASAITATLLDNGSAFDPTQAIQNEEHDLPANVTDRRLGLFMIGLLATDLRYRREGEVNRLEFSLKR